MTGKYYHTKESVDEYIRLAQDFDGKYLIDLLVKVLPAAKSVLELGSGPGKDWKILSQYYETTGSDNSKEFIDHLHKEHPTGRFLQLDAVTIEIDETFDAIYSNKVFHHLTDQQLTTSIQRQNEVLNPGGLIMHSFWRGEGSETFKGMFVNYHDRNSLESFFGKYFDILALEEYKEFENAESLLLLGRKI